MELDPDDPDYPQKCGDCYKELNDYNSAKTYYIKLLN